jgi:serine/threonine protein kinase
MYSFEKKIGEGNFGGILSTFRFLIYFVEVYLGKSSLYRAPVAIKKFAKRKATPRIIKRESDCLDRVKDCDGVAKLLDSYEDDENHYLVFEFVEGENLLSLLLKRKAPLSEDVAKVVFRQLCNILVGIHESKVIHHGKKD